jgi:KipI family sensor histidine kinase inhibitor
VRTTGSDTPTDLRLDIRPCGDAALLVETDDLRSALALHRALRAAPPAGVVDLVPAARTVLVKAQPGADLRALELGIRRAVEQRSRAAAGVVPGGRVDIPVTYDGEDLAEVAGHVGCSAEEVVAAHTGQEWTVAFSGFAPGFGYLVAEDERLTVPRRSTPRTAVPAGAVGLAGRFSGVYPRSSPGGWQLIGRTETRIWDVDRPVPALFTPGTTVRFVRI